VAIFSSPSRHPGSQQWIQQILPAITASQPESGLTELVRLVHLCPGLDGHGWPWMAMAMVIPEWESYICLWKKVHLSMIYHDFTYKNSDVP